MNKMDGDKYNKQYKMLLSEDYTKSFYIQKFSIRSKKFSLTFKGTIFIKHRKNNPLLLFVVPLNSKIRLIKGALYNFGQDIVDKFLKWSKID